MTGKAKRVLILFLLPVLLLSGCVRAVRTPPLPNNGPDVARGLLPLGNCTVTADRVVTESFAQLVADSDMIVDAEMGPMTGTRNLALSGSGNLMIEGVDFQVNVREYLFGTGPAELTISLPRSDRQGGEELACRYADYVEPAVGSRWILFLQRSDATPDLALPAGYPWRYEVVDGKATPFLLYGDALERFPARPVDELLTLLKR